MPRAVALLLMTILAGCRGSDEPRPAQPDDAGPSCAAGFDLAGEVCVLHFDACDDRSIPRPGGGCEKVGVETCAKGFREDGHGGCEAIQPASPCGKGTMAIPGETACREVMDCGTDPYGGAPDSALHVDKSASPDGADGTLAHPYASIAVAVASSSPGAIIAIAAGTYPESFDLDRPLTLQGRCPSMVEISGDGASGASIGIVPGIADITIRGLSITGRDVGIDAQGGFTADSVRIHDIGMGVSVDTPGESPVVIRNALIENTVRPGVRAIGGAVAIERSVIRDATSTALANLGMAVSAVYAASGLGSASIVDSVIERGVQANVFGCTALTVERSLLRGGTAGSTTPSGSLYASGCTRPGETLLRRAKLVARDVVIEEGIGAGIHALFADATLERITITNPRPSLTGRAMGLLAEGDIHLDAHGLTVIGGGRAGIALLGTDGALDHVLVRDTLGEASDGTLGIGLAITPNPMPPKVSNVTIRAARVSGSHLAGIAVVGSTVSVDGCMVEDTRAETSSKGFGDGIAVAATGVGPTVVPAKLTVTSALVKNSARAGFSTFGALLSLDHSRVECSAVDIDFESKYLDATGAALGETDSSVADGGQNACGCGVAVGCLAASAGLAPIKSL